MAETKNSTSYAKSMTKQHNLKLQELILELPTCCQDYFRAIADRTSILTRIGYAHDLRLFFMYLCQNVSEFQKVSMIEISSLMLRQVTPSHIERFIEYITYYEQTSIERENHAEGKSRKLAAIRTLLQFWFERGVLEGNVGALVRLPKRREKAILRLEPDEVANLLDLAENGLNLSDKQRQFHQQTRLRDTAILSVFLGTGIRISELVGLNLNDLNFSNNSMRITRKGGKEAIVYFWDEVADALCQYLKQRKAVQAIAGHEDALFLSLQKKRITSRAIQNLVEKYAHLATPLKHISPHKLRSTFGTSLYRETGDIYLVADVLGHRDVNTTRRHYAAIEDERRRDAAKKVRLRTDPLSPTQDDEE